MMKNTSQAEISKQEFRLPHERDQITERQESRIREEIAQAEEDLEAGQQDTDLRGAVSRKAIKKTEAADEPEHTGEEDPLAGLVDEPADGDQPHPQGRQTNG